MEKQGYTYIVTNQRNGTLYIGVTSNLSQRVWQHKEGTFPGFTQRYGLKMLVYYEVFDRVDDAIAREKAMKKWLRKKKLAHIEAMNPDWRDLYETLY